MLKPLWCCRIIERFQCGRKGKTLKLDMHNNKHQVPTWPLPLEYVGIHGQGGTLEMLRQIVPYVGQIGAISVLCCFTPCKWLDQISQANFCAFSNWMSEYANCKISWTKCMFQNDNEGKINNALAFKDLPLRIQNLWTLSSLVSINIKLIYNRKW